MYMLGKSGMSGCFWRSPSITRIAMSSGKRSLYFKKMSGSSGLNNQIMVKRDMSRPWRTGASLFFLRDIEVSENEFGLSMILEIRAFIVMRMIWSGINIARKLSHAWQVVALVLSAILPLFFPQIGNLVITRRAIKVRYCTFCKNIVILPIKLSTKVWVNKPFSNSPKKTIYHLVQ